MTEISKFRDHSYDLRKNNCLEKRIIKSCKYGKSCESGGKTLGCPTWNIIKAESLQEFKMKLKFWTPLNCLCKLCKTYIGNVGYV